MAAPGIEFAARSVETQCSGRLFQRRSSPSKYDRCFIACSQDRSVNTKPLFERSRHLRPSSLRSLPVCPMENARGGNSFANFC